jgi:hypothetical protein
LLGGLAGGWGFSYPLELPGDDFLQVVAAFHVFLMAQVS